TSSAGRSPLPERVRRVRRRRRSTRLSRAAAGIQIASACPDHAHRAYAEASVPPDGCRRTGVRCSVMDASDSMARARAEGLDRLDAALARMGSDPCVASLPLLVQETAGDAEQQRMIRLVLIERVGLQPDA